ncbi:MAG: nucleotidyl transferase AbiEii/AbiGii toxin family protein [Candidatus Latescibacteria bacterium]|nr:nucleotidyl transferase AbiEii/AbiGii toxin family protein [Candidatus Latescibacterota bacterium]
MKANPGKPVNLPDYGEACLRALLEEGLADRIVLGGAFGLLHYLDYRPTRDVDAWWCEQISAEDRCRVMQTVADALSRFGPARTREWGDVVSIELQDGGRTTFSFQIAHRSALLEPPTTAPWIDIPLDSLADLVASKMKDLVERGAPRDFRDIFALCQAGMATGDACWALWSKRQKLAGSDTDRDRAFLAIETHLTRIAQHRPLAGIADPKQRAEAEKLRAWFSREFLHR